MQRRARSSPRLSDRQGSVLVTFVVSLSAVFAVMALAVDLGMLYVARGEAQRAADAGALAGAVALIETPQDESRAKRIAAEFTAANHVMGQPVSMLSEDVNIYTWRDTIVVVDVKRSAERGNAVGTWFAKTIGVDQVDVGARAGTQLMPTGSATCIKPFIVPDAFDDTNGNGRYDSGEYYDRMTTGYGSEWRTDRVRDLGRSVTLYPGSPDQTIESGWYFLFRLPGNSGGADIRRDIADMQCNTTRLSVGEALDVDREPGAKRGPVSQGVNDLIDEDPGAYWDDVDKVVKGSKYGDAWRASPRVFTIVAFDPTQPISPGMRPITVTNYVTVFAERSSSGNIVGRVLPVVGIGEPEDCRVTNTCSAFARYARLVQ